MKRIALLLVLALIGGPLIRVVTNALVGAFGEDAAIAATVVVVASLLAVGALAWRRLEGRQMKPQKTEPSESAPSSGELTWPVLVQPTAAEEPLIPPRATATHDAPGRVHRGHAGRRMVRPAGEASTPSPSGERLAVGAKRWSVPWFVFLVGIFPCIALVWVALGPSALGADQDKGGRSTSSAAPATPIPRTSASWTLSQGVHNEGKQKAALMGWDVRDMKIGPWEPCNDVEPVTDTSCVKGPVTVKEAVVGVLFDHPQADKPEYRQFVLWLE